MFRLNHSAANVLETVVDERNRMRPRHAAQPRYSFSARLGSFTPMLHRRNTSTRLSNDMEPDAAILRLPNHRVSQAKSLM